MQKKLLIDAMHREETRIVLLDKDRVEEFDFESGNKKQLAGNIYLAKVTRVEPSLQAAFLDYGGNRHGFLAFSEIHPDYYQIPIADKEALLKEELELTDQVEDFVEQDLDIEIVNDEIYTPTNNHTKSNSYSEIQDNADEIIASEQLDEEPNTKFSESSSENKKQAPKDEVNYQPEMAHESNSIAKINNVKGLKHKNKFLKKNKYKIQEVIKVRQVLLIQVVKDERGNKGAALTTYISLAGRYCVLMPNTARGGGISRKITNVVDRKKLKDTASQFSIPEKMGLIIRTAGAKRTKAEIKRDFEYLLRQWEQIRDLTLNSIAPCPIYEEGSVIKRSIRDLYNKDINEIIVEGESGFKEAKDYMKMLMPSHAKKIKCYNNMQPIFSFYGVEKYLSAMFNPTVQLRSGGYIVIGITEALVAIDVNSGRSTKESGIEETALRTNLEAAEEIARQLRMRDLAGLIVIDFIDMEERKNNISVEKKIKDSLKLDKARIQVGRISSFGLLEMSRQRLRYGMVEATTQPCLNCHGTGLTRSNQNLALAILRELENKKITNAIKEAIVKAPVDVANYILNQKRHNLEQIEKRLKMNIFIQADITIQNPHFTIELNKNQGGVEEFTNLGKVITIDGAKTNSNEYNASSLIAESKTETTNISSEINGKKQKRRRRKNYKNKRLETIESTSLEDLNKEEKTTPLSDDKNLANIDQLKKRTNFIEKANIDPARVNHTNNPRNNKNTSDKISSIRNKKKVAGRSASIEKDERFHNAKLENPEVLNQKTTNPNTKKRMVKPVKEVLSEKSKGEKPSLNKNIAGQKKITSKESRTGWWSRKKQDNEN